MVSDKIPWKRYDSGRKWWNGSNFNCSDQILVQNYFKILIEENEDYRLAGIIDNAALADMYCAADKVDLILMDVCTADGQSGLKHLKK